MTVGARGQEPTKPLPATDELEHAVLSEDSLDEGRFELLLKAASSEVERLEPSIRVRGLARVEGLAAIHLYNTQEWLRAEQAYEKAIRASVDAGAEDFSLVIDLAHTKLLLEKHVEALALLRRALAAGYDPREDRGSSIHLRGVALDIFAACGLFDLAHEQLVELEKLVAKGDLADRVECAVRRIGLDLKLQRFTQVVETTSAAIEWPGIEARDRELLRVRLGMAQSELARGTSGDGGATATLNQALSSNSLDVGDIVDAELVLLDLALRSGDLSLAAERLTALDGNFAKIREDPRSSVPPLQACLRDAYAARLSLDSHATSDELRRRRNDLEVSIEAVWQDWERVSGRTGGVGFLTLGDQRMTISEAMRLEMALEPGERGFEAALSVLLRAQRAGSLSRRLGEGESTLADVRNLGCRGDTTVMILFPAAERSHVFELSAANLRHFEIASRDKLVAASGEVDKITLRPPANDDPEKRKQAFDSAVKDWTELVLDAQCRERSRNWKRLTVIGADLLSHASIEFLRPQPDRELGLSIPIAHVTSMPLLVALERRADSRPHADVAHDLVIVADPIPAADADSARLDLSSAERTSLRGGFEEERILEFYDRDATLDAVTNPRALEAAIVTVIAHGRFTRDSEIPVAIELTATSGRPNLLDAMVIERLTRAPRFVGLYVCRAGSGPARMGDDAATNLGTACFAAGSDAVIASRGDLPLLVALSFARSMHVELARGATPSEACLAARREIARSPATADPYFRSMLRVEGLGHRPVLARDVSMTTAAVTETTVSKSALIATALAVAISLGLGLRFVRRRRGSAAAATAD